MEEYSKILQDIMEYSRSLLFHLILEYSRIFQNVTKYSEVLKNLLPTRTLSYFIPLPDLQPCFIMFVINRDF